MLGEGEGWEGWIMITLSDPLWITAGTLTGSILLIGLYCFGRWVQTPGGLRWRARVEAWAGGRA